MQRLKNSALTLIIEALRVNKRFSSASISVAGNIVSRSGACVVVGASDALDQSGCGGQDGGIESAVCDAPRPLGAGNAAVLLGRRSSRTSEEAVVAFVAFVPNSGSVPPGASSPSSSSGVAQFEALAGGGGDYSHVVSKCARWVSGDLRGLPSLS